jgi:hypothetical protein
MERTTLYADDLTEERALALDPGVDDADDDDGEDEDEDEDLDD